MASSILWRLAQPYIYDIYATEIPMENMAVIPMLMLPGRISKVSDRIRELYLLSCSVPTDRLFAKGSAICGQNVMPKYY